ncbi:MAG TPA: hypothetical protein VMD74_03295 [Candidatus Methylomirabilis sp.]|nr:hypothetical protein [Candidatus Methylomirabilis sp.]
MSIGEFFKLIGRKKQTIAFLFIVFLAVAVIFSAVQPFKYGSSMKLLTVINFGQNVDPYTASRSNEYLSNLLAKIVSSGTFFAKVEDSGYKIDKNYFSGTEKQQIKKWSKTVKAKSVADTGIIAIDVYHTNRDQAEEIAKAVAYTLQTTNTQYHGYGNAVEIKIIDAPLTSTYPVQPDLPLNLGVAFALAIIFSFCYVYLFPGEKYDLHFWPAKRNKVFEMNEDIDVNESTFAPALAEETVEEPAAYPEVTENALSDYGEKYFSADGSMDNVLRK